MTLVLILTKKQSFPKRGDAFDKAQSYISKIYMDVMMKYRHSQLYLYSTIGNCLPRQIRNVKC